MQKTKTILILAAIALVAAALVSVTYTQFVNAQNGTTPQTPPPSYNGNTGYYPPNCYNTTTGYYPCYPSGAAPQQVPQQPPTTHYQTGRMGMCGRNW